MVFDQIMALTKGGPAQSTESISYLSLLITTITVALSIIIHSMMGYVLGRNKGSNKFYNFVYLFIVSGMFVPFAILMMPLVIIAGSDQNRMER